MDKTRKRCTYCHTVTPDWEIVCGIVRCWECGANIREAAKRIREANAVVTDAINQEIVKKLKGEPNDLL
jgi:uncharacterized membrane protein